MGEVIRLVTGVTPFEVKLEFGEAGYEAERPAELDRQQAEVLLVTAMRIVQEAGHDPWDIVHRLDAERDR